MKSCITMSVYNGNKYIIEQLDSLKNQSRKFDGVFIADDCSKDNTYEIISEYIKTNKLTNWFLSKNNNNLGWQNSFVNLINTVPTDYDVIFMCDQDDIWYSNKCSEVMQYFEKYNIGLLATNIDVIYTDNNAKSLKIKKLGNEKFGKLPIIPNNIDIRRPGCALAVKRELVQECYKKHHNGKFAHDMLVWMYAYCKRDIYYLNESLMKFRRFASSSTYMKKGENRFLHKKQESLNMIEYLEECKKVKGIDNEIVNILDNGLKLEYLRQNVFVNKDIFSWLKCLKYITYYPNPRRWFGDLYFTFTYME